MKQLVFDSDFSNIVDEKPIYWRSSKEIPICIIKFIESISNLRPIFESDTAKYYCHKCFDELDDNFYCHKCNKSYIKINSDNERDRITIKNIMDIEEHNEYYYYYVFDVLGSDCILYLIRETVFFYNRTSLYPYKTSKMEIDKAYYIDYLGVLELIDNKYISFEKLDKDFSLYYDGPGEDDESYINYNFDLCSLFEFELRNSYLYTENLDVLKNTIYRYTGICNIKEQLKRKNGYSLNQLVYLPIHFPQFEYLLKLRLYNLAYECNRLEICNKTFKGIFGVEKSFLPFMIENNISYMQLKALELCQEEDISLLNFIISEDFWLVKEIVSYTNINLKKLKEYFDKNSLSSEYIFEYFDYIRMASEQGLDLKNKKILFPKSLIDAHNDLYLQVKITDNPIICENIKSLSQILQINKYEDDNYVIFPADSLESLIDESSQQHNCVRTYFERYSNNECQIYFMREKKDINKSFVTIEVRGGRVVQKRAKFNELVSENVSKIIEKWEQQLINVVNN